VGEDAGVNRIEKEIKKYRGVPFKYGGLTMDGFDCVGFLYRFYADLGVDMPESIEEANKENYSEIYLKDENRADDLLQRYFDIMPGFDVNPMELLAGDALIVRNKKNNHLFPAVYGGNGIAVSSFIASYVRTFALNDKLFVIRARRIV